MYTVYVISYYLYMYTVLSYMQYAMAQDKTECSQEGLPIDITSATYTFSAAKFKFRRTVG